MIGLDCELYLNSATYDTPTWAKVTNVRDVTVNEEAGEAEDSVRDNAYRSYEATLLDASIEFEMVYKAGDSQFSTLQTAYRARTVLDVAAVDGDIATSGTTGLRMQCKIFSFTRNEPMEDVVTYSLTLKPVANSDSEPEVITTAE